MSLSIYRQQRCCVETVNTAVGKFRVAELFFEVPLNYSRPGDGTLRLFARSVRRLVKPVEAGKDDKNPPTPWLVYLQGGPGMGCRPPQEYGWVGTALDKGYQVCKMLFLFMIFPMQGQWPVD